VGSISHGVARCARPAGFSARYCLAHSTGGKLIASIERYKLDVKELQAEVERLKKQLAAKPAQKIVETVVEKKVSVPGPVRIVEKQMPADPALRAELKTARQNVQSLTTRLRELKEKYAREAARTKGLRNV